MRSERLTVAVECRASESGPSLHAVILQEGRAATGGLAEVFAPGSTDWPASGIAIRTEHHGLMEARAVPERGENGEIRISAPATPAIFAAVSAGKRYASVEFHAQQEVRTAGGVREIQRALLTGAALTDRPEYDSTSAELRERRSDLERVARVWLS